ncbi:MAG: ATP-binding cassette domain-containing protein, partial [Acidimicrobiia bacterium]|nr:ATP-binding cassette domain-containing protein [Acidimicrobiia bacterium]
MANITMTDLGKIYPDGTRAVGDVDLDIQDGEFLVLVGPSGCGKSTILRMIAGLEEISEGEMYIGETLVNDVQPKDRDIAMV